MAGLMLGALGIVFGDIGTSPLYTLRECLAHSGPAGFVEADVFDILSLVFWSLMVVVTLKYLVFILRADNRGEGGIMALLALVPKRMRVKPLEKLSLAAVLVVIGCSLMYADGAITPAISLLSSVEGLTVAKPELGGAVVPITLVLIVLLFAIQSRGTAAIGALFGPVMLLWFTCIGGLGAWHIAKNPAVLEALMPTHAANYFVRHGWRGVTILGLVVLSVTGGEALYADMGHFGIKPIRRVWTFFVLPSLVLSYFGQGALVLANPASAANPFFEMVPKGGATYALVVLSSVACVIASQALISGSFSLTRQAMQMGLFPRVTITHTAEDQEGQIYIPEVNYLLAAVCIMLVVSFKSSTALADAYGLAVTGTMIITSIIYFVVVRMSLGWPLWRAVPLLVLFLMFDIPFLFANMLKIPTGGYVSLAVGAFIVVVMLVWHEGRRLVGKMYTTRYANFDDAWEVINKKITQRTAGVGVFMASATQGVPPILVHLVERTRTLHKQILLLTVITTDAPTVEFKDRLKIEDIGHGFARLQVFYGFMQQPDIPRALNLALKREWIDVEMDELTYYLARERIIAGPGGEMGVILETLFAFLSRNAVNADRYFRIPHNKVIEVGTQIDL